MFKAIKTHVSRHTWLILDIDYAGPENEIVHQTMKPADSHDLHRKGGVSQSLLGLLIWR